MISEADSCRKYMDSLLYLYKLLEESPKGLEHLDIVLNEITKLENLTIELECKNAN